MSLSSRPLSSRYRASVQSPPWAANCRKASTPSRRHGSADIVQHDLGGYAIELHVTARWQEREPCFDLLRQRFARSAQQRLEASIESKLATVVSHEIEHRARSLAEAAS